MVPLEFQRRESLSEKPDAEVREGDGMAPFGRLLPGKPRDPPLGGRRCLWLPRQTEREEGGTGFLGSGRSDTSVSRVRSSAPMTLREVAPTADSVVSVLGVRRASAETLHGRAGSGVIALSPGTGPPSGTVRRHVHSRRLCFVVPFTARETRGRRSRPPAASEDTRQCFPESAPQVS